MELNFSLSEVAQQRNTAPLIAHVLAEVCEKHSVKPVALRASDRRHHIGRIRNEFFYRALIETPKPKTMIGRMVGVHGSTVAHGAMCHAIDNNLPLPRGYHPSRLNRIRNGQRRSKL